MITFDANTFSHDEVHIHHPRGYNFDVLIDIDGLRQIFIVGWYDHEFGEWRVHSEYHSVTKTMRWSFLPLAIYETNPELRKTVKI